MIWLTWRQFRGQAVAALAVLAAVSIYLVVLGRQIRHTYEVNLDCTGCSPSAARGALELEFEIPLTLIGLLVVVIPALVGAFWGAPLIAREIETGTHRLVWNQSVTRTRWLAVKLGFVTLAGVAVTGVLSTLLTWAASPYDELVGRRFTPLEFPTRNIVPLGYAAFAVVLGITIGLLARRTVLAMAVTLAAFTALQILVPTMIRPHLQPPVTDMVVHAAVDGLQISPDTNEVNIEPNVSDQPGAWVLSGRAALRDAAGDPIAARSLIAQCPPTGDFEREMACFDALPDMYYWVTYQPADRYWTFQWLELAGYLILAGLLAGFLFWRIPRGLH